MTVSRVKMFIKAIDNVVYMAMTALGIYLFQQGDVLEKFKMNRTNFAVSKETLTELPTIITYILHPKEQVHTHLKGSKNLSYKRDFWIHFQVLMGAQPNGAFHQKNLEIGENKIDGTNLIVKLEIFPRHHNWFKITPINFPLGGPHNTPSIFFQSGYRNP